MNIFKAILNNPYFNALKNVRAVLDFDQKKQAAVMILLLLVNAVFDVLGLATIMGLINSALKSQSIIKLNYTREDATSDMEYWLNDILRSFYHWIGSESLVEFLFILSILLFLLLLIKNVISLIIVYVQTKFGYNVSLRLNKKMFKYYYDQGYLFIRESSSGKKVYGIIDIPYRFASGYLNQLFIFSTELVILLILGIGLLVAKPLVVLMLGIMILPVFLGIYAFTKNRVKAIGSKRNIVAPINYARVFEFMKAYVDVKLGNHENQILDNYGESQSAVNLMDIYNQGIYQRIHQRTNDIIFGLGLVVIFTYSLLSHTETDEIVTLLTFFGVAAYKFLPGINRMMNSILSIKNSGYVIEELKIVANKKLEQFANVEPLIFEDEIKLDNISYRYPDSDKSVLKGVNLTIKKGKTVGIVGGSGSGKSTLLKILLRLIEEDEGTITIGNIVMDNKSKNASLQKMMGYVEQDVFILNGSLIENIAFGHQHPDYEKLKIVVRNSMLQDFVDKHPDGIHMRLGEGGVNLSGGQKQRVGIARALYKDSEILIFDEVTSALDSETEKAIVESINHISTLGKTVVIVAHRISTLEKCDQIFEISEGSISGERQYETLVNESYNLSRSFEK